MRVLPLSAYDAILGIDWLAQQGDMYYNWQTKTVKFIYKGKTVVLKGISQPNIHSMAEVQIYKVMKWTKGNVIWAFAVLETQNDSQIGIVPSNIQQVL